MKPLGTITKFFPFLEEKITKNIESLMLESLHYADFIDRVREQVTERVSSPMMVFFSVVQLFTTGQLKALELIFERHQDIAIIQPFIKQLELSTDEATTDDVLNAAEGIVQTTQNPWVAFEMHMIRFYCASTHSLGSAIEQDALENLQLLIDSNPEMNCFNPQVHGLISTRWFIEGNIPEALKYRELQRTQHLSCDDLYWLYNTHISLAYYLRNLNTRNAHGLLDEAREINKFLGYDAEKDWAYHNIRATVHNARGEYSLSLQLYDKAIRYRESQRIYHSLRFLPLSVSFVYGELEDGENALEWAKMAMDSPQFLSDHPSIKVMTLTRVARAYALLGDLEEAELFLDESEAESLTVGSSRVVAENLIVSGHIAMKKGNYRDAMFHFERGLEIAEKISYQNRINSCLIGLVKTEIALLEPNDSIVMADTSGPWMKLLQSEVEKKELPGINGFLLLLKTELRLKQGRIDDAGDLIVEIRRISQNPGLQFLDDKADDFQLLIEQNSD